MKNPNSPLNRMISHLKGRWNEPDFLGGDARFQVRPFAKDLGVFIALPGMAALIAASLFTEGKPKKTVRAVPRALASNENMSMRAQVITFGQKSSGRSNGSNPLRKAPGTLIRLRLLNVVETLGEAPVQARILDAGLGAQFVGGILIGDGSGESSFDRMNISFRYAKPRDQDNVAFPINARALSLDGTLGVEAEKKEGAFARGVFNGSASAGKGAGQSGAGVNLQSIIVQALSAGLAQEFGAGAEVERNRAQVLVLQPGLEFFAELKDFFPAGSE